MSTNGRRNAGRTGWTNLLLHSLMVPLGFGGNDPDVGSNVCLHLRLWRIETEKETGACRI